MLAAAVHARVAGPSHAGSLGRVCKSLPSLRHAEAVSEAVGAAQHPPFLYGTHYSCPGYVMYWLVRAAPAHLLRCSARKPVTQSPGAVHGAVCLLRDAPHPVSVLVLILQSIGCQQRDLEMVWRCRWDSSHAQATMLLGVCAGRVLGREQSCCTGAPVRCKCSLQMVVCCPQHATSIHGCVLSMMQHS